MSEPSRPNLLYLVHRLPHPPDKGDRIRAFHILRYLAQRANVHLACLADEPVPAGSLQALEALCSRVRVIQLPRARWFKAAASLARGGSATVGAHYSSELMQLLRGWAASTHYHAVLGYSSLTVPYLRHPDLVHIPAVVDLVDVDSQKWFDRAATAPGLWAPLYRSEGSRLRRVEAMLPSWARAVTLVSEAETELFRSFCPSPDVYTITNGVDLDYFRPYAPSLAEEGCVFVGALDYQPNIDAVTWFCKEVWPAIIRNHPNTRLRLVGRRPVTEVLRLGEIPGVDVIGQVPDVRPHVAWAAVAVAPLRIARGVRNMVLEALSMRKPVVASPQALTGLRERLDLPALRAVSPAEWAEHVGRLLDDEPLRRKLGSAGRRYVEAHHSWDSCVESLADLLDLRSADSSTPASSPELSVGDVAS